MPVPMDEMAPMAACCEAVARTGNGRGRKAVTLWASSGLGCECDRVVVGEGRRGDRGAVRCG